MKDIFAKSVVYMLFFSFLGFGSEANGSIYKIVDRARQYKEFVTESKGTLYAWDTDLWVSQTEWRLNDDKVMRGYWAGALFVSTLLNQADALEGTYYRVERLDEELADWPVIKAKSDLYPGCVVFWKSEVEFAEVQNEHNYRVGILLKNPSDSGKIVLQINSSTGKPEEFLFDDQLWDFSHGRCFSHGTEF